ncbi:MAG: hypothetical protein ACE5HC_16740 [Candidatus Binatia bacterium]
MPGLADPFSPVGSVAPALEAGEVADAESVAPVRGLALVAVEASSVVAEVSSVAVEASSVAAEASSLAVEAV